MDTPIEVLVGNLTMTNLDFCDAMLANEPMDREGLEERGLIELKWHASTMIDY